MFELIPGILEKDWEEIEKKLVAVKPFAKTVHIDLIDGKFAQNTTWLDPEPFKPFATSFSLELHMMVENPLQYLQPFAAAGFHRFIGHIEEMPDQGVFVARAEELGDVGLAIDGKTAVDQLNVPVRDLDCLLFMTINAGFSGQEFQPEQLEKIKQVPKPFDAFPIAVDGGINEKSIIQARDAGATRFVVTSSLFSAKNVEKRYEELLTLLSSTVDGQSR